MSTKLSCEASAMLEVFMLKADIISNCPSGEETCSICLSNTNEPPSIGCSCGRYTVNVNCCNKKISCKLYYI
jgi:hypothetical protein